MNITDMSVGIENFKEIRDNKLCYIDKTEFIYDLIETNNKVSLFTRPRRFGKTLNMMTLSSFLDITEQRGKELFDGLDISKHEDFCKKYMNQSPVIYVSLKDIEGQDFTSALSVFSIVLSDLCASLEKKIIWAKVSDADTQAFYKLRNRNGSKEEIQSSLKVLTRILSDSYNKPVVLLIDEYDVPIATADKHGYYEDMIAMMRSFMSFALKTNEYLDFAVITGCLRIAKESIFTGTNNFVSYSIKDNKFSEYFGFTEKEVNNLLIEKGLADKTDEIKEWYDGYLFGNTKIYCPWDVVNYISAHIEDHNKAPENYWINTSHNDIIRLFLEQTNYDVSGKFETLLNGGNINQSISENVTYENMFSSEDNLWSILYMTGYLTVTESVKGREPVKLILPNKEIFDTVKGIVETLPRSENGEKTVKALIYHLWNKNVKKASDEMSELLFETISYHDYHEDYYHAFIAGIFKGRGYDVKSNREQGKGRSDLYIKDKANHRAMIIEAKKAERKDKMQDCTKMGYNQIIDKEYYKDVEKEYKNIFCYAVCFYEKTALIASVKT